MTTMGKVATIRPLLNSLLWCAILNIAVSQECEKWTTYFNYDHPIVGDGDVETLAKVREIVPFLVCENPTEIDVRVDDIDQTDYRSTGQVVKLDGTTGFSCLNSDQTDGQPCLDYQVRFCCPAVIGSCPRDQFWSDWFGVGDLTDIGDDETINTIRETDEIHTCARPLAIEARLVDNNEPYIFGYNKLEIGLDQGLKCMTADQPSTGSIDWWNNICPDGKCPESWEAIRVWLLGLGQDNNKCKDYKIRFCCELTVAQLLGDNALALLGLNFPIKVEDEPTEADDFFSRVETLFSFNDDEDPETC